MEIIKYKNNGKEIDVRFDYENNTVWLTQQEIATLYKLSQSVVSKKITKYVKESQSRSSTYSKMEYFKYEGERKTKRKIKIYNLEIIIAIGYKINSSEVATFKNFVESKLLENKQKPIIFNEKPYEIVTFVDDELQIDVNVDVDNDTVWLSQKQISELFGVSRNTISEHIKNIFLNDELIENEHVGFSDTLSNRRLKVKTYDLEVITLVGHRVNTKKSLLFRKWVALVLKQYINKGYVINNKRCLECQQSIIDLNNKVNILIKDNEFNKEEIKLLNNPKEIFKEKLIYEDDLLDGYIFIRKLFLSAKKEIIIIDGYISVEVLEMLEDIKVDIIIYTYTSATLTKKDIKMFSLNHKLQVNRMSNIHDRFIIIDEDVYVLGSSLKDIGKKRSTIIKLKTINKDKVINI